MSNNYAREVYNAATREARKIAKRCEQQRKSDRVSVSLSTFYSRDNVAQLVRELNASIYGARE